jgi:hypothetical protein
MQLEKLILISKAKWAIIFFIVQFLLIYFIPSYRYTLIFYIILFLIGEIFYRKIIPDVMNPQKYIWLFSPLVGILITIIIGSYLIAFNTSIEYLILLPIASIFINLWRYKNFKFKDYSINNQLKNNSNLIAYNTLLILTLIVAPIILILAGPAGISDTSTPFRVGPDAALYTRMTQYLLDGGTWLAASTRSPEYQGMALGDITQFTNSTMDWPFLYFYRWGLTTFQICNVLLNGLDHAYKTSFTSMILPHLFLMGLIFFWLREKFKLALYFSILGAVGFTFNVNILNLWFEGFYGNMFSLFLYCFIYLLIAIKISNNDITQNDAKKIFILTALIFAAILASYGEGLLFVLPCLLFLNILTDFIIRRVFNYRLYIFLSLSLLLGIVIILPCQFLLDWFLISLKQIFQEGGNGYTQPYWASLNEILGFNNIYQHFSSEKIALALKRSPLNFFITISSTILILFILTRSFNAKISIFYLDAYLLLLIFFMFMYFKSPNNNYGFMKMYIFLLPILFVYFWRGICLFVNNRQGIKIISSITLVLILHGLTYVHSYYLNSVLVNKNYFSDHQNLSHLDITQSVIFSLVKTDWNITLPAVLPGTYLTDNWDNISLTKFPQYSRYLERKIYFLLEKENYLNSKFESNRVIYEGPFFVIIDSGLFVKSLLDGDKFNLKKFNFLDALNELNINKVELPLVTNF